MRMLRTKGLRGAELVGSGEKDYLQVVTLAILCAEKEKGTQHRLQ